MEVEGSGEAAARVAAWAGPLSTRLRGVPSAREASAWAVRQVEWRGERWTPWTPLALGWGAALSFVPPREPQVRIAYTGAALAPGLLIAAARSPGRRAVLAALVLAAGGAAGLFRQPDGGWKVRRAQDLRGRRPWTWGSDA